MVSVLIADDHALFRDGLRSMLESRGVDVIGEARNGREAVDQAKRLRPDIVLMDLQMPVMDGFECTARIRKTHPDLPILALTAARSDEIEAKTFAAGMNDIVGKPFIPKELRAKILSHLKNDRFPKNGKRA